ncbi:hypothetical protein KDW_41220 [Dictyobacter vulcani]|uniref:Uncharacterized protein n=1 Tax=Dictyobacter vulcani TaxID=2607529 RepID=A0A5J4KU30_9CHLR|nr:hypothetical protein [Dictyobacter vulcani]GER89960.1 hypothetical protein KDW_41220 [Dictyobacter vulcani]
MFFMQRGNSSRLAHRHLTRKALLFAAAWCLVISALFGTYGSHPTAQAQAAQALTPPQKQEQLRQALKRKIHVTHHQKKTPVTPQVKTATALPAYNNVGTSDDNNPTAGNFDGNNSYSAQAMQGVGLVPGQNYTYNNVTFVWPNAPAGKPNNYSVSGQVIPVTPAIPNAAKLGFLAASSDGNSTGNAMITYTDTTTQSITLNVSDWTSTGAQIMANNSVAETMSYFNQRTTQKTQPISIFYTDVAITAGKIVQSVTLPATSTPGQIHIFAVGISGPAWNNTGTSDDSAPAKADLDGTGNSLSAQALQSAGIQPGSPVINDGISYPWPTAASATPNNYKANGQILPVTPVPNATTLGILGTGTGGSPSGNATITYTDNSTQIFVLGLTNWWTGTPAYSNNVIAATLSSINLPTGKRPGSYYLYAVEVSLQSGKTVQSVTLPTAPATGQLHIFAVATRGDYNNIGTSDDANAQAANLDGGGSSFSAQALQNAHIKPGQQIVSNGINYLWPSTPVGAPNNYQANGQTIAVTPVANATTLGILGIATGTSTSGTATITYTDTSTQAFPLGLTNWWTGAPAYSNTIVATLSSINTPSGARPGSYYLFTTEVTLTSGKTVQSITLPTAPTSGQLHIFAIGTRSPYNNIGISDDASPTSASFDGAGNSYSSQDFTDPNSGMGWNPGDTLTYNGMDFIWPNVPAGQADNNIARSQSIPVAPVANADTIGFIGASHNGDSSGNATLVYTDNSSTTIQLGMGDWTMSGNAPKPAFNNFLFALLNHRNSPDGQQNIPTYLFYTEFQITPGKVLQSVTLPKSTTPGQVHIFSIGTRAGNTFRNNVGTSDDTSTTFANFDTQGHSYSLQALQAAAHITEGNDVFFNGVDFRWPSGYSVLADNYRAIGQTIAVTPVANANTLAFLGSSTIGNASGTAKITYTDNSTQTFTLGFTDWANSTIAYGNKLVATMPYRNSASTGTDNTTTYLYYAETPLNPGKTIASVTLPNISQQLHVFSVGTRGGAYNNAGTSDDAAPYFANFDNGTHSYSAQGLQSVGLAPGQSITTNGIGFVWPNAQSNFFNNYQATGQKITVSPVAGATTLGFLGAATNGATSGTATITYTDNSTQTFTLGFADWTSSSITSLPYGNSVVATMPYRNTPSGAQTINTYVFTTSVTLQAGKTIQSVTLPTTTSPGLLHVFAIGTK